MVQVVIVEASVGGHIAGSEEVIIVSLSFNEIPSAVNSAWNFYGHRDVASLKTRWCRVVWRWRRISSVLRNRNMWVHCVESTYVVKSSCMGNYCHLACWRSGYSEASMDGSTSRYKVGLHNGNGRHLSWLLLVLLRRSSRPSLQEEAGVVELRARVVVPLFWLICRRKKMRNMWILLLKTRELS